MDEAAAAASLSAAGVRISDFCLLVQDLDRAIHFYRDLVGFQLRRLAPGFADFFTAGVTLALWQVDHMQTHLHVTPGAGERGGWRAMAAIQVDNAERVRTLYRELSTRGVPFLVEPQAYPWNAYACYFTDPEQNLWEIYTWQQGGHANLIFNGEE
jgi:uncharacterized protein